MAGDLAQLYRRILERGRQPVLIVDGDSRARYVSGALERVYGHSAAEFVGHTLDELIHPEDAPRVLNACRTPTTAVRDVACQMRHVDGSWRDVEIEVQDARADPHVEGLLVTIRDVSQRRLADEALVHKALHDALTGLPNRSLLQDRLGHALARAHRQWRHVAVLFLDLDHFKVVNDSLGHEAGDLVLTETAHRLLSCVRAGDTVARFGGDEFAVLLEDVASLSEAEETAERIATALGEPIELGGRSLAIGVSIGITIGSDGQTRPEDLLREADLAMYHAKSGGRARHSVFQSWMQQRVDERLQLESDLQQAIRAGELRLHYQPIVRLGNRDLIGFEALVRWDRPGHGLMQPSSFVPLAEETGLIVPIGRWVLHEACQQLREWQELWPAANQLTIAVNVSARQLQEPSFIHDVSSILRETGIEPACLTLEITESVLVQNVPATIELMHRLKNIGLQLAIDDFGTGYSSLSYLKRLPVDRLKIDGSFVAGLGRDDQDQAIVRGIVDLAGSLELTTTAEGIETDAQLSALQRLGGSSGQGYFFARPVPPDEVLDLLRSRWRKAA